MNTIIVNNPAVESFLAKFRNMETGTYECNVCVETMSFFLAGEISKYLSTEERKVKTPLGIKKCDLISEEVILLPVLRAGVSMLNGFQRVLPNSKTGFVWAHRNNNAIAELDKYKFPADMENKTVIILDTMIATGGTINLVSKLLKPYKTKRVFCASILSIPYGLGKLSSEIDSVFTIGVSDSLNDSLYVYPGVGDSGDRLYG